jgi:DNA-binding response OmpR family regulator
MPMYSVAVIDDDPTFLNLMDDVLTEFGHEPVLWMDAARGDELIRRKSPDILILDLLFGREPLGLLLLAQLRAAPATAALPVIVCSAAVHLVRQEWETLQRLAHTVFVKPLSIDLLDEAISRLVAQPRPDVGHGH